MDKNYYSVFTKGEQIWIYADTVTVEHGCLSFFDVDDGVNYLIATFSVGHWQYCYEADPATGESIPEQIPFWKRHNQKVAPHEANRKPIR